MGSRRGVRVRKASGMGKRWNLIIAAIAVVSVLTGIILGRAARPDESGYSQATPEDTIRTARLMIERGQAASLERLIYAENEEMRKVLRRAGAMFSNLQKLGVAVEAKFPEAVAKLKADTEAAAKDGKATGLLAQLGQNLASQRGQGRRGRNRERPAGDDRAAVDQAVMGLFADPYAWLKESEGRLTTAYLTDESVSLRWDEKSIFPPIGLQMRLVTEEQKWYLALPTGIPVLSRFMPRSTREYEIVGSLIQVLDNAVIDLRRQVETGQVSSLEETARKAGENAFVPAAMVFFAYTKAIEERAKAGG
jgi:hypothetical protein